MNKKQRDNRAKQMNPNNIEYWKSRVGSAKKKPKVVVVNRTQPQVVVRDVSTPQPSVVVREVQSQAQQPVVWVVEWKNLTGVKMKSFTSKVEAYQFQSEKQGKFGVDWVRIREK